jgi:hypothetical protein
MSAPAPFTVYLPEAVLADLCERLARSRWPDEVPILPTVCRWSAAFR